MIHFLELLYFLLLLQACLRCLYFWQLKEYRLDRFKDFLTTSQRRQFFLPTRWFLRPKLTLKVFLLIYLSLYFSFILLSFKPQAIFILIAYLCMPITVSLAVLLLKPLTDLITGLIIFLAKLKLTLMPKSLTVIGITGSFGKTSTKEILAHLLAAKYSVCKTKETNNTAIGVALTVLKQLNSSHQYFIVEMGAYKIGEIKKICRLVKPKIAVITGITSQHLSLFGGFDNLIKAKSELLDALPPKSLALFNGDNLTTRCLAKTYPHLNTLLYAYPKKPFKTNLLGDYQQLNLQAAVLLSQKLHLPLKIIKTRLAAIPAFKTMMVKKSGIKQSQIIDDSYNANPEGFLQAIEFVNQLESPRKILITSGIIELGQDSQRLHRQIALKARPVFSYVFVTKPEVYQYFRPVFTATPDQLINAANPQILFKTLKPLLNSQTVVLLASRLPLSFIHRLCQNRS